MSTQEQTNANTDKVTLEQRYMYTANKVGWAWVSEWGSRWVLRARCACRVGLEGKGGWVGVAVRPRHSFKADTNVTPPVLQGPPHKAIVKPTHTTSHTGSKHFVCAVLLVECPTWLTVLHG